MFLGARLAGLAAIAALVPGCPPGGDDDPTPAPSCETGEIELVYGQYDQQHDLADGDAVPLLAAPQGGHILLIGARARSATRCSVVVNAALRDPCNQRVVGLDERSVVVEPRSDGWAIPGAHGLADYANVAVCPSAAAGDDVFGLPYQLEVRISASHGGPVIATFQRTITPTCTDDYCRSDCAVEPPTCTR
ncbi:MAG: hypothetical protein ACTHU0_28635 [Kofleriaceae bacterium]